jgi:hypothetical protein
MSEGDFDWREDERGRVWCASCQEPIGKPYWAGGCCCGDFKDIPTSWHRMKLRQVNAAWDNIKWERA